VGLTERLGKLATGSAGPGNCFPVLEQCCSTGYPGVAVAEGVPGTVVTGLGPVLLVSDSWSDIPPDHKPNNFVDVVPFLVRGIGIAKGPIVDHFLIVGHSSIEWTAMNHSVIGFHCC